MTANGPLPTTLTFLSSLPNHPLATKVRFLGCATNFDTASGLLELQHCYPQSTPGVLASVDVNVIMETLKRENLEVGAWVNVIGYMGERLDWRKGRKVHNAQSEEIPGAKRVHVQAIMLWNAEAIRLGDYEKAVEDRLANGHRGS